eukprot:COSAG06_NODE_3021_length_5950_cov_3.010938_9_plen_51_part_00
MAAQPVHVRLPYVRDGVVQQLPCEWRPVFADSRAPVVFLRRRALHATTTR